MSKKLSIITPSYNSSRFLESLLLSMKNFKKKYDFFEYIVVDGNSNDNTIDILEKHEDVIDKLIIKKDRNMYEAINTGVSSSTAPHFSYINCDDSLTNDFFESHTFFNDKSISVVYGKCNFIFGKKNRIYNYPEYNLHRFAHTKFSLINQPGTIFTKKAFDKLNGFNENYNFASDHDFFIRLGLNNFKFFYTSKVHANFLVHSKSLSSLNKKKIKKELNEIYKTNGFTKNFIYRYLYNHYSSIKFKIDNYL